MSRFFDSHAWNTSNRAAAKAVMRAVDSTAASDAVPQARGYVSAEVADATVRAGASPVDGWLIGGGRVKRR